MKIVAVVPARYASSRFPGKALAEINGKPLVWWVYQRATKVGEFDEVYVATDDHRIQTECDRLGMNVIMTSDAHPTGTDRVGEVAQKISADLYVNVQGDEPLLMPDMIREVIKPFHQKPDLQVSCLMTEIGKMADLSDSTVPKVVINGKSEAVYFSRLPIPYPKGREHPRYYKQICAYGLKPQALEMFCNTERGPSERAEEIELLRFIENGIPVHMVEVDHDTVAVDTPTDLAIVRDLMKKQLMP